MWRLVGQTSEDGSERLGPNPLSKSSYLRPLYGVPGPRPIYNHLQIWIDGFTALQSLMEPKISEIAFVRQKMVEFERFARTARDIPNDLRRSYYENMRENLQKQRQLNPFYTGVVAGEVGLSE